MVVLPGTAIISVQEEAHSPLPATLSKALKIRNFSPAGGVASFIAIIPLHLELTSFISCSLKPPGSKRLAATWRSQLMEDRLPTKPSWTTPAPMPFPPRRQSPILGPEPARPV